MKPIRFGRVLAGAVLATALSACGGGAHTAPGASSGGGSLPATTGSGSKATAPLTVTVKVPSKTTAARSRRLPQYVSPATTSITVYVYDATLSLSTTPVSNATANCNTQASPTTCTVTLPAYVGTDALTVYLSGSNGTVLSQASGVPVTVTPGTANVANLTFDGVLGGASLQINGAASTLPSPYPAFTYGAASSVPVVVVPQDAQGYAIVGPGDIVDPSGNLLVAADGSTQGLGLSTGEPTVSASALTWNAGTYTLSGTLSYSGGTPQGQGVDLGLFTLVVNSNVDGAEAAFALAIAPQLDLADDAVVPGQYYRLTYDSTATFAAPVWDLEVPSSANATAVDLYVADAYAPVGLGATDTCSNGFLDSTLGNGSLPFAKLPADLTFSLDLTGYGECSFQLVDGASTAETATVNVFLENPQVIIERKVRK